jgi:hypothetical protein
MVNKMTSRSPLLSLCCCILFATGCYQAEINVPNAADTLTGTGTNIDTNIPVDTTTPNELPNVVATWSPEAPDVRTFFWTQDNSLHLRLQSRSLWLARSIRNGAMTIWLDPQGKKQKHFGLQFRGPLRHSAENATDRSSYQNRTGSSPVYVDRIRFREQTHLLTKKDKEGTAIAADLPLGDCQQFFWEDGVWFLDLEFPMDVSLDPSGAVMIQPGTSLAIGFEEKRGGMRGGGGDRRSAGAESGRKGGRGGRGGGGGGRGGMGGGGQGGKASMNRPAGSGLPAEFDGWILLNLPPSGIKAPLASSHE